jgi:hypothetical protein
MFRRDRNVKLTSPTPTAHSRLRFGRQAGVVARERRTQPQVGVIDTSGGGREANLESDGHRGSRGRRGVRSRQHRERWQRGEYAVSARTVLRRPGRAEPERKRRRERLGEAGCGERRQCRRQEPDGTGSERLGHAERRLRVRREQRHRQEQSGAYGLRPGDRDAAATAAAATASAATSATAVSAAGTPPHAGGTAPHAGGTASAGPAGDRGGPADDGSGASAATAAGTASGTSASASAAATGRAGAEGRGRAEAVPVRAEDAGSCAGAVHRLRSGHAEATLRG